MGEWRMRARDWGVENESEGWEWRMRVRDGGGEWRMRARDGEWRMRARDGERRMRARDGGVYNERWGRGVENESEGWGVENESEGWGVENESEGWGRGDRISDKDHKHELFHFNKLKIDSTIKKPSFRNKIFFILILKLMFRCSLRYLVRNISANVHTPYYSPTCF